MLWVVVIGPAAIMDSLFFNTPFAMQWLVYFDMYTSYAHDCDE